MNRPGRKPLPPEARRSKTLGVPVTPAEKALLLEWSARAGAPLSTLVRRVALEAAAARCRVT